MTEPWASVDEVAKDLGVTEDSVHRSVASPGLRAHDIGRPWKLELSEVGGWVRAQGDDGPTEQKGDGGASR